MQAKKTKKKNVLIHKPYLKGTVISAQAAKQGWKILEYQAIFIVLYLLIGSAFSFNSFALRLISNTALIAVCFILLYLEGARQGESDVAFAEISLAGKEQGKLPSDSDLKRCFHPLRGLFVALCGVLPILLIAIGHALTSELQVYSLGVLPSWVSAYENQAEIGHALAYYNTSLSVTVPDILRTITRLFIYPYVNIIGSGSTSLLLLLDQLSPLLVVIVPLGYAFGYSRGEHIRSMVHGNIQTNNRRHKRKEKRARQARVQQQKELI